MPAYWGKTNEGPHPQFDGTLLRARAKVKRGGRSEVACLAARQIPRSDGKTRYAIAQVRDKGVQRSPLHCICPCVSSIYLPGIRSKPMSFSKAAQVRNKRRQPRFVDAEPS